MGAPDVVSLELELGVLEQGEGYRAGVDDQLQAVDGTKVQANAHKASIGLQHRLDVSRHLTQHSLLDLGLDNACCTLIVVDCQLHLQGCTCVEGL